MPLTAPCVPTGMNAGVCTSPWGVFMTPHRASPSVATTSNRKPSRNVPSATDVTVYNRGKTRAVTRAGLLAVFCVSIATPLGAALTGGARLASIYDSILRAQFDRTHQELARACPPAPREACAALEPVAVWWEIQLDPDSRAADDRLQRTSAAAIAAAEAWAARE